MAQQVSAQDRVSTFEEAARLDPDEHAGELDAGRWSPVTKSTWRHGAIAGNVYAVLRAWARAQGGWSVSVGDPGTKLAHDPDVLRGPDVAVARADRVPTGSGADGWLEGGPDLAVEVMGDAQSASALTRKALEYLRAGSRMVWVLDLEARHVMIFTPPDRVRVLGPDDHIDAGEALPGLGCAVADLFEE